MARSAVDSLRHWRYPGTKQQVSVFNSGTFWVHSNNGQQGWYTLSLLKQSIDASAFQTFSTTKTEPSTKMKQLLEMFPILSTNLIVGTTHIKLCAKLLSCVSLTNKTQTLWLTSMWSGPSIPSRLPLQLSYCLTESPTASPPSSTMPQELIDLMTTQLPQTSNHSTTSSTPPLSGSISSSSKLDTFESKQEPTTPPLQLHQ